jgi:hypothetical protein
MQGTCSKSAAIQLGLIALQQVSSTSTWTGCLLTCCCPVWCVGCCPLRFIDAAGRYYELSSLSTKQLGGKAISEDDLLSE